MPTSAMCNKVKHLSKDGAKRHLHQVYGKRSGMQVYKCRDCMGTVWHFGHSTADARKVWRIIEAKRARV